MTFTGFPREGIQFLRDIDDNNNRDWFEANKHIYQAALVEPAQAFIMALGERLQTIAPNVQYDTRTNGSGSLMRIYRDVRFSKDKSPYKNWIGIVFWEGQGKKSQNPGFYFGISGSGAGIHAGMYGFEPAMLAAYREAVDDEARGSALAEIVVGLQTAVYTLHGDQYTQVPRGFAKDHPRADLLRYKGLFASAPQLNPNIVASAELVDACFAHCQQMAPLQQWLAQVKHRTD
ncbi:MAG: DUF2461 domain-containing protein [Anaerolineales bacterium]|nr:DUF2461 domain-containing protein [Anaerolineales bacterium]